MRDATPALNAAGADGDWWSKFLDALAAPALWADGVIALLSTLLSIAAAGAFFLHQIDHDRALLRSQLNADRLNASAGRRAEVARELGRALIEAASEFATLDGRRLEKSLRSDRFGTGSELVPGAEKIRQAYKAAELELELDQVVMTYWSRRLEWWRAVGVAAQDAEFAQLAPATRRVALLETLSSRFRPWDEDLVRLGKRLMKWDGGVSFADSRGQLQKASTRPPTLSLHDWLDLMADSVSPAALDDVARAELNERTGQRSAGA